MEEPAVYKLYVQPGMKLMLVLIVAVFGGAGGAVMLAHGPKPPSPIFGVILLAMVALYLLWILALPNRITLSQDGAIEFISVLQRRAVRAQEIVCIRPSNSRLGFFVVSTANAKIRILAQFDGFHEFLTRLQAMNPTVELKGC